MKTFYSLLFLFSLLSSYSQENKLGDCTPVFEPETMDFEKGHSYQILLQNTNSTLGYLARLDTTQYFAGSQSLKIMGENFSTKSFATSTFEIPLNINKGTEIKLSAWVRTDSLMGENGGALVRLMGYSDKKKSSPALFEFNDKIIKGTTDWTNVNIETTLNENINQLDISALMQGQGSAWFDNFDLKIDGVSIRNTNNFMRKKHPNKFLKELDQYIRPFEPSDYFGIDEELSKSRLIGLGEATHGTKQIFEIKKNLIAYLINNHNVRIIALEAYYQNTEELNDYIQTGKGDLKEILANLEFWQYFTSEFMDFIEWLKLYNSTHSEKISITGIDSQSAEKSLKYLENKFQDQKNLSVVIKKLKTETTPLSQKINLSNELLASLDKEDKNSEKNVTILSQSYYLNQFKGLEYSRKRDSIMAINTEILFQELPENKKVVLWAHDLHIQKQEGWTGGFLAESFGNSYVTIGFLLGSGKFTALDKSSRSLNSQNKLNPLVCNSLESILNEYKSPVQLLNLRKAAENSIIAQYLLNRTIYKRSIGALDKNMQFTVLGESPQEIFDLLIFIKSSNGSSILPN